jgi:hypothetical protein
MRKVTATVLLLMALALPVLLFWQLGWHSSLGSLAAGALAVAAGWALNVGWAFSSQEAIAGDTPHENYRNLKIAAAFGWVCPVALVLLTWLALRFLV